MQSEVKGDPSKDLLALVAKFGPANVEGTVGFTASYAAAVHENVEMKLRGQSRDPRIRRIENGGLPERARPRARKREPKGRFWDPQGRGQAKFLESAARDMTPELYREIADGLAAGLTWGQAVLRACLKLQREAQLRCPVNTGNLKASAFSRLEESAQPSSTP